MVSLVSCKSTETETRTASSRVMFRSAAVSGVAEGQSKSYRGILASKDTQSGEWMTDPDWAYCTEWECAFSGENGVFNTTRYRMYYPEGTFKFYALGYDGSEQLRTEKGVLQVVGGESAHDYILATTEVALDGVEDKNVSLNFNHLFAQVRFELILRSVEVDEFMENIELVDISALGYRLRGKIDLGADDVKITPTDDETLLSEVVFGKKYMVIPHSGDYTAPAKATIRVRFDGKEWEVVLDGEDKDNMTLNAGKCRVIRMTYDGVQFTTAGIPQWSIGEDIVVGGSGEGIKVPQWNNE